MGRPVARRSKGAKVEFGVVMAIGLSVVLPLVIVVIVFSKMRGTMGSIKGGIPATALIQSISETGMTISAPGVGPEAPVYKLDLLVTPPGGGQPYQALDTHAIPRIYVPMVLPGATIGILVDPADPMKVVPDWTRITGGSAGAYGSAAAFAGVGFSAADGSGGQTGQQTIMSAPGGVTVTFGPDGQPISGVGSMASAVQQGTMPTINGSAAQLLATGTHGTAVITTAMPLGKKVREVNPNADPSRLDAPVWLFTLEVTLAGEAPFPAMFGHWVRADKIALLGPGVKLSVSVDQSNRSQEVAIDWDKSPIV